ncbi:hypothetical protein ZWY2020_024935 [Hordeum vulgare]|nr:hypothetical protein ZWY2020_024935 [Hordeum vulgare]
MEDGGRLAGARGRQHDVASTGRGRSQRGRLRVRVEMEWAKPHAGAEALEGWSMEVASPKVLEVGEAGETDAVEGLSLEAVLR